jgi:hypothetical protein
MVPTLPTDSSLNSGSSISKHTVPIVLGVLGGLVALLLVVLGLLFRARRKAGAAIDPEKVVAAKEVINDEDDDEDSDIKKPVPTSGNK